jgi:hypothetical protein
MKIRMSIDGGGEIILNGSDAEEAYQFMLGYASEQDLATDGCSVEYSASSSVIRKPGEVRITT